MNPQEFSPEQVKSVVTVLQGMSITKGAALQSDVVGSFFEEVLRSGFKQDAGMYFTHANLVYFMAEAVGLDELTVDIWKSSNHPENRLPYVIDTACGSGAFLLRAMQMITSAIWSRKDELVTDQESEQFYNARMSDSAPNYWAEQFIYGMDPKFVMAITAKINMVLHGDGSAHIFKYDGLKPLSSYGTDPKFRPLAADSRRSIPRTRYSHEVSETFDVVLSNPPFGITLSKGTKGALSNNFSLPSTAPSESLFLERWFQLLKPRGRLGVVLPESLLNTSDGDETRLFLYRTFWIRAIVSLPRNLFIETPTLTSLLFAQKKTRDEIARWDSTWERAQLDVETKLEEAKQWLRSVRKEQTLAAADIEEGFISRLSPIISKEMSISKRGSAPVPLKLPSEINAVSDACRYYLDVMNVAGFQQILRNHIFGEVSSRLDYEFSAYAVDEVGYKLSARKERIRPNQLCRFLGVTTRTEQANLHLSTESVEVKIDIDNPTRVLDYIKRDVKWA